MFNIDFGTLPEKAKKNLAPEEIMTLNGLFTDPTIQQQLENIEEQRKIRQKWKYAIYGGCTILTVFLSFIFGSGESLPMRLINGFFYTIGSGDNSFSPVIWAAIISYSTGIGLLYKKFASKIEIPLKSEVLQKMCPLLYSKLEYSYDEKYSFDELELLRGKNFLSSYDSLEKVEDSVHFGVEKDGKIFSVNGFELETSEMRGSGKNRRRVTTNHCYLMKAVFPSARIPLSSDLFIMHDEIDGGGNSITYIGPILGLIIGMVFSFIFLSIVIDTPSITFFLSIAIGLGIGYAIYHFRKKSLYKNRVQLENMEFEKLFDVKCEDQVTSRMIITPAFMDRIVSFVNKTGNQYEFLMQGNTMYIKRQVTGSYLEAGTEKNMLTNLVGFTQFYTDMREIIQFTYDMNLMYLSKTDTTKHIETDSSLSTINPITITKISNSKSSLFGGLLSRYVLKM
ncbi:DUF3137 domain-containing protein [Candidatus Gracilibacteria bacterium]|nr:DUF3137 domain-containing protein [Candidatus Gracilibacteria bacterium]